MEIIEQIMGLGLQFTECALLLRCTLSTMDKETHKIIFMYRSQSFRKLDFFNKKYFN